MRCEREGGRKGESCKSESAYYAVSSRNSRRTETLCATSIPKRSKRKKVDEALCEKKSIVDQIVCARSIQKEAKTHVLTNPKP